MLKREVIPEKVNTIISRMIETPSTLAQPAEESEFSDSKFTTKSYKKATPKAILKSDVQGLLETESEHISSAYDINLAEFPIAHLSTRLPKGVSNREIVYNDKVKDKLGDYQKRTWVIEGQSKYGLGGPSMLRLIYEIFQIWKEQGFEDKKIHIGTYYYLLKRMKRSTGGKDYKQLIRDLECIKGLDIKAYNACYIPADDVYLKYKNFKLFPKVEIYGKKFGAIDPENDYLYIIADDDFYQSVKQNTIYHMPLSIDLVDSLKPQELKLALYLAKIFTPYISKPRVVWKRNIYDLADQIPINVKLVELKNKKGEILLDKKNEPIRRKDRNSLLTVLRRTCKSLQNNEQFPFLTDFNVKGDTISFYCNQNQILLSNEHQKKKFKSRDHVEYLVNEMIKICNDRQNINWYYKVAIYIPDNIIYPTLSEAKHEGKKPAALFTKLIIERGSEFFKKNKGKKIMLDEKDYYLSDDLYEELNRSQDLKREIVNFHK